MNPLRALVEWFDVRPGEVRSVSLSFVGAFLIIGFLILARSLREAFYLSVFDVKTLPYITMAVAVASVPAIGLFSRLISTRGPHTVLNATLAVEALGLLALWRLADHVAAATIAFYMWTAIGAALLTSGFWIVTSEHFALRGAKRLFGLIGAGGTAGAMVAGNSLTWLSSRMRLVDLVPGLVLILVIFFLTQFSLPHRGPGDHRLPGDGVTTTSLRESLQLVWRSSHLRTLSLIVFSVTAASTLIDFQFKDAAQQSLTTPQALAGFFGSFYGWAGAIALLLQLLLASRLMGRAGVGATASVLPVVLLLGSVGVLLIPTLAVVTLARGGVYTLSKSLYRSAIEVLYVPLPALVRRKTKTFIDSTVDAVGDGFGAGVIFALVTLLGMPTRYLSIIIGGMALFTIALARRAQREYFRTLTGQLLEERARSGDAGMDTGFDRRDLLSASFTRLDLESALVDAGIREPSDPAARTTARGRSPAIDSSFASGSASKARDGSDAVTAEELIRGLARDFRYRETVERLARLGDDAQGPLLTALRDPDTDFVIRRRIPAVLARIGDAEADDALVDALAANRFEVRYRAAIALVRRRKRRLPVSSRDWKARVWEAVRRETGRDRPVWELQRLLDSIDDGDELVSDRIEVRGQLSLEHTFRLLSLVLNPQHVRSSFQGIIHDDERLKSFALEYLEHVLPPDIRQRLWPFIGDPSEYQRERGIRPLDAVVSDLIHTGETLFGSEEAQAALRRMLQEGEPGAD
jgi:ATP/ADP translocase